MSSNLDNKVNYQEKISKNWIEAQKIINKDKKIHLLKTHNALCNINGNNFTDSFNTAGVIYITRDPRNIITSLANHYKFGLDEAFNFLSNKRKIIFPTELKSNNKKKSIQDDFNFLGDWSFHYKSWKNIDYCPIKIIRYEDILDNTNKTFTSIIKFLSQFIKLKIDEKKIKNTLNTTSFQVLKKMEIDEGFDEARYNPSDKNKSTFFNLGKDNNWKNFLDKKMIDKINMNFENEMKELNYL